MSTYAARVGKVIREIREQKGLSQERLAELAGVHRTYVGGIERGERNVTLNALAKFAHGLDVEPSEIIARVDKTESQSDT